MPGEVLGLVDAGDGLGHLIDDGGFFITVGAGVLESDFQLEEDEVFFVCSDEIAEGGSALLARPRTARTLRLRVPLTGASEGAARQAFAVLPL